MHSDVASAEDGEVALASTKMYSGPTAYGFTFKYPPSWKPRKKNGNKHLYELEVKAKDGDGAMIGITIDQVKVKISFDDHPCASCLLGPGLLAFYAHHRHAKYFQPSR